MDKKETQSQAKKNLCIVFATNTSLHELDHPFFERNRVPSLGQRSSVRDATSFIISAQNGLSASDKHCNSSVAKNFGR
jgi:hypothetical protein